MSFAFQDHWSCAGSLCWYTASTPPDDVFLIMVSTIKTPVGAGLSVPGMPRAFQEELTSNWEIVLYAMNHEWSQGQARPSLWG